MHKFDIHDQNKHILFKKCIFFNEEKMTNNAKLGIGNIKKGSRDKQSGKHF